jgi:hypothetical protein
MNTTATSDYRNQRWRHTAPHISLLCNSSNLVKNSRHMEETAIELHPSNIDIKVGVSLSMSSKAPYAFPEVRNYLDANRPQRWIGRATGDNMSNVGHHEVPI